MYPLSFLVNGMSCDRIYSNTGNYPLIYLLSGNVGRVLDIGCGNGANARLVRQRFPHAKIDGITVSPAEHQVAECLFDNLWILDVED